MTSIRPATPEDAEGIAKAHTLAWQRAYRGVVPEQFLDTLQWELREAVWRKELTAPAHPSSQIFVAVDDSGAVFGFVAVGPCRDDDLPGSFEIHALYLVPETWSTGVGGRLLEAALSVVPEGAGVALWVLEGNARGRRFYEAQGFTADGTSKVVEIGGQPLVELRYTGPGTVPA